MHGIFHLIIPRYVLIIACNGIVWHEGSHNGIRPQAIMAALMPDYTNANT